MIMRLLIRGGLAIFSLRVVQQLPRASITRMFLGGLNYLSNWGSLKIASSKDFLLLKAQHVKAKLPEPQVSGISNLITSDFLK